MTHCVINRVGYLQKAGRTPFAMSWIELLIRGKKQIRDWLHS